MDLSLLLQLGTAWSQFQQRHPKFLPFLKAARPHMTAGTVVEVTVTPQDGQPLCTNLKLTAEDLQALSSLMALAQKGQ